MQISIAAQIAEVKREIALRQDFYPRRVAQAKMRQGEANEHMSRMRAVLRTLEFIAQHRETIVAAVKAKVGSGAI